MSSNILCSRIERQKLERLERRRVLAAQAWKDAEAEEEARHYVLQQGRGDSIVNGTREAHQRQCRRCQRNLNAHHNVVSTSSF